MSTHCSAVGIRYLTVYPHCMETNSTLFVSISNVYLCYSVKWKIIIAYTGTITIVSWFQSAVITSFRGTHSCVSPFVSRIDSSILHPIEVNVRGELPIWHNFGNLNGVFSAYCSLSLG